MKSAGIKVLNHTYVEHQYTDDRHTPGIFEWYSQVLFLDGVNKRLATFWINTDWGRSERHGSRQGDWGIRIGGVIGGKNSELRRTGKEYHHVTSDKGIPTGRNYVAGGNLPEKYQVVLSLMLNKLESKVPITYAYADSAQKKELMKKLPRRSKK
jgi:hypothetical protein